MKKIVITSGFFNPLHVGHMNLMREAKKLGDFLVVIVNNDAQVKVKGSVPFMPEKERLAIVKDIKHVDAVFLATDKDGYVPESLKSIAKQYKGQLIFAKGGDRNFDNLPESEKIILMTSIQFKSTLDITLPNGQPAKITKTWTRQ